MYLIPEGELREGNGPGPVHMTIPPGTAQVLSTYMVSTAVTSELNTCTCKQ